MSCCAGVEHTICLSDDGTVYTFGINTEGQLGVMKDCEIPTQIPNLPRITQISCGFKHTVCVDEDGFIWSFGYNCYGQLGTGDTTNIRTPQQITDIPKVFTVSCGSFHTLMITINDFNLWSFGGNEFGQLCLEHQESQSKPQQTSYSNTLKIAAGGFHSLFQNNKGEIYGCGMNSYGQLGIGCINICQIFIRMIKNQPQNIIYFCCGTFNSLFLDEDGNVFSVGYNMVGSLGLGHNKHEDLLAQIPGIPPIQNISCSGSSCYLLDFDGNVWSFGHNNHEQLGQNSFFRKLFNGTITSINVPKK